jgi:predicted Zn-dependent protease with MMP-like domain
MEITSADFDEMVNRAYKKIPGHFRDQMENVVVTIEDYPPEKMTTARYTLLGLFEGVPKIAEQSVYRGTPPSKITLYEKTILSEATTLSELEKIILEVLMHEVAHYFGYNDKQMIYMDARLRKKLGRE